MTLPLLGSILLRILELRSSSGSEGSCIQIGAISILSFNGWKLSFQGRRMSAYPPTNQSPLERMSIISSLVVNLNQKKLDIIYTIWTPWESFK